MNISKEEKFSVKPQNWIFSIRLVSSETHSFCRHAVVGPARASTVEAALNLANAPEPVRAEIRADPTVRKFIEESLAFTATGYYAPSPFPTSQTWIVCIGAVHEVLP